MNKIMHKRKYKYYKLKFTILGSTEKYIRINGSIYLFGSVVVVVVASVVGSTGNTLICIVVTAEFFSAVSLSMA